MMVTFVVIGALARHGPEPVGHVVSSLKVVAMHRSVARPLCPLRRAGDENGKRRLIGVVMAFRVI